MGYHGTPWLQCTAWRGATDCPGSPAHRVVQSRRQSVHIRPAHHSRQNGIKLCTRRAHRAESQARRTRQPSVHFSFDIKQLTTTNHAQKAWIILLKSCRHIAAHRHGPGLTCTVRYPCTHAGAAAYPPATGAGSAERLGICTEGVDETVHRLFDERSEPMLARPAGDRL